MIDPLLLRIIFVAGWTVLTALIILINIVWRKIKRIKASKIKRQEQADERLASFIKPLFLIIVIAVVPSLASAQQDVSAFVTRFYQQCLNREPDLDGLSRWVNELNSGAKTGADVAYGFVFSQEFINRNTTNEQYLTMLYRALFNREPDTAGYNGWLSQLNSGAPRRDILNAFLNAPEFASLCYDHKISPTKVSATVRRFYKCLGREPDLVGVSEALTRGVDRRMKPPTGGR